MGLQISLTQQTTCKRFRSRGKEVNDCMHRNAKEKLNVRKGKEKQNKTKQNKDVLWVLFYTAVNI